MQMHTLSSRYITLTSTNMETKEECPNCISKIGRKCLTCREKEQKETIEDMMDNAAGDRDVEWIEDDESHYQPNLN